MKTYSPKASDAQHDWYVVDAEGLTLGRMATEIARVLRGKHKPVFAPHMDMGDFVIVVNADKVVLTSDKANTKMVHHHSGYPGGLRSRRYGDALGRKPAETVKNSIVGMLPHNRLGRAQARKLKVYAGPTHPHAAQQPAPLVIAGARRES